MANLLKPFQLIFAYIIGTILVPLSVLVTKRGSFKMRLFDGWYGNKIDGIEGDSHYTRRVNTKSAFMISQSFGWGMALGHTILFSWLCPLAWYQVFAGLTLIYFCLCYLIYKSSSYGKWLMRTINWAAIRNPAHNLAFKLGASGKIVYIERSGIVNKGGQAYKVKAMTDDGKNHFFYLGYHKVPFMDRHTRISIGAKIWANYKLGDEIERVYALSFLPFYDMKGIGK